VTEHTLTLVLLPDTFAVCRLPPDADLPAWAGGEFVNVTRTRDELSVVCSQGSVPDGVRCERDWRCLRVAGTLDFSLVGILASLLVPLAESGISVFATSTFDTDYLLVRQGDFARALGALQSAGYAVQTGDVSGSDCAKDEKTGE
jgi:hypothetical protein